MASSSSRPVITVKQQHKTGDSVITVNQQHKIGDSVITVNQERLTGDSVITVKQSVITIKQEHESGDVLISLKQKHPTDDSFINVQMLSPLCQVYSFQVERDEPLKQLHMRYREREGMEDYRKIIFMFRGRKIEDDDKTVNDVGLKDGDRIHVLPRLIGD